MSRREKNRGAAMVIVLCVMVVFLALSTTIVLAGTVVLNTARNNIVYERGKVQASSLSELFVHDIEEREFSEDTSDLLHYVRDEIIEHGWPAYDEESDNRADAVRTFTMDAAGEQHQIRIEMYWTSNESIAVPIEESKLADHGVRLIVDVISTLNNSEYHVKREFKLMSTAGNTDPAVPYPCLWRWETDGRKKGR